MKFYPNELSFLLQSRVSSDVWVALGTMLCMGLVCIFCLVKDKELKWHYIGVLCLVIYIFIVLCNTVVFRSESNTSRVVFVPFWSYMEAVKESRSFYLIENLLNIVLFVPVGLFLKMGFLHFRPILIVLCGFLLSITIETSQMLLHRGWFEVDDMIHNTIGTLLGFLTSKKLMSCRKR